MMLIIWWLRTVVINGTVLFLAAFLFWFSLWGNEDPLGEPGGSPFWLPFVAAGVVALQVARGLLWLREARRDREIHYRDREAFPEGWSLRIFLAEVPHDERGLPAWYDNK